MSRNTPLSSPLLTCRQVCKPTAHLGTHHRVHLYSPADRFVYLQHVSEHTSEFTFTHLQTGLYTSYSTSRNTPLSPLLICRQVCIPTAHLGTHPRVHLYSPADRFVNLQHVSEHTSEFTFTHLQTGLYTSYSTSRNTPLSPLLTCRQVCIPTAHLGTHHRVHLYSPADRFVYLQHISEHTPEFTFTHLQTGL